MKKSLQNLLALIIALSLLLTACGTQKAENEVDIDPGTSNVKICVNYNGATVTNLGNNEERTYSRVWIRAFGGKDFPIKLGETTDLKYAELAQVIPYNDHSVFVAEINGGTVVVYGKYYQDTPIECFTVGPDLNKFEQSLPTFDRINESIKLPQPDGKDYQMVVESVTFEVANQGVRSSNSTQYYLWYYGLTIDYSRPIGLNPEDIQNGKYPIAGILFFPYLDPAQTKGVDLYLGGIIGITQVFTTPTDMNMVAAPSADAQKIMILLCSETAKEKQADPKFCTE
jgi:hypothetical protein